MLSAEPTMVEGGKARIEYRPLGPILAVMPWNFPIWQVLRGAVPALIAGNTYVLKHAPNVMGCAYLLRDAFKHADFPEGVFEVINVTPDGVSTTIADPRIAAVTLTGSVRAGIAIGAQAGAALKKCVLELDRQVRDTLEEGATLLMGGKKAEGPGNFYEPTVFADVTDQMTSFKQELFGPVASIITARDAAHALELANDSEFGLASTIYTGNVQLAEQMAGELETGGVFINGYCATDPRVTFGGVKKSGFGRELSHFGVREFCNAQTVWLDRR